LGVGVEGRSPRQPLAASVSENISYR